MFSEEVRCELAVKELQRLATKYNGVLKPSDYKKVVKQAKIDERTLYQYIKERDIII